MIGNTANEEVTKMRSTNSSMPSRTTSGAPMSGYPPPRTPFPAKYDSAATDLELFVHGVVHFTRQPLVDKHAWKEGEIRGEGKVHVVRIFGVTMAGNTVALDIHCYRPYLYCRPPAGYTKLPVDGPERKQVLGQVTSIFEQAIQNSPYRHSHQEKRGKAIHSIQPTSRRELGKFYPPTKKEIEVHRRALAGKSLPEDALDDGSMKETMLLVQTYLESDMKFLRYAIHCVNDRGQPVDDAEPPANVPPATFESDMDFTMRFMSDLNIKGCGWVRIKRGAYKIKRDMPFKILMPCLDTANAANLFSTGFYPNRPLTQAVAHCRFEDVEPIEGRVEYPPMRVLSFDLETTSLNAKLNADKNQAPPLRLGDLVEERGNDEEEEEEANELPMEDGNDADEENHDGGSGKPRINAFEPNWSAPRETDAGIIQIGAVLSEYPSGKIINKTIFTLGSCSNKGLGEDIKVFSFGEEPSSPTFDRIKEERRMLREFTRYAQYVQADFITGFNTLGFDWNYLVERYKHLGMPCLLGRTCRAVDIETKIFQSRAQGTRQYMRPIIPGVVHMDMRVEVERTGKKLRSYKLDAVARHYLKDEKKEVRDILSSSSPLLRSVSSVTSSIGVFRFASRNILRILYSSMSGWSATFSSPSALANTSLSSLSLFSFVAALACLLGASNNGHAPHARHLHCVINRFSVHKSAPEDWSISSVAGAKFLLNDKLPMRRGFVLSLRSGPRLRALTYLPLRYSVSMILRHRVHRGSEVVSMPPWLCFLKVCEALFQFTNARLFHTGCALHADTSAVARQSRRSGAAGEILRARRGPADTPHQQAQHGHEHDGHGQHDRSGAPDVARPRSEHSRATADSRPRQLQTMGSSAQASRL
jgi:hypothetical protein